MAKKKSKLKEEVIQETQEQPTQNIEQVVERVPKSYVVIFATPSKYILKNHSEVIEFNEPNTYFKGDEVIW